VDKKQIKSMKKAVVLIVEDEALIRMSAVQMIEDAGYLVLDASNADEAIQILESRSDIGAVITDIRMPGSMDGLALAHAIRARWAPIHLIVTSGTNVQGKLPANVRFIHKPYSARHVTTALSERFCSHKLLVDC
jgi:CheY-like chemotaxis protein